MQTLSQKIGKVAEQLVCDYLKQHGLKFITANYQCKCGEIDLIMRDAEVLVFVEVRHRKFSDYGDGVVSVIQNKQRKIIKAATYYLLENNLYDKVLCRFDIVATSNEVDQKVQWIKDAFWKKW
jgi:putative endonuclease